MIATPTPLGLLLLPLGLFLFARGSRPLFWAVVLSAPFFDTAVLQLPMLGTLIRPAHYFGLLFLLRGILAFPGRSAFLHVDRVELLGALFLCVVSLSTLMPWLLKDAISVIPEHSSVSTLQELEFESLRFSSSSFTQLFYPCFYIVFFIVVRRYISRHDLAAETTRTLVLLSIPVVASGLLHLGLVAIGFEAPLDRLHRLLNGSRELRIRPEMGLGGLPLMYSLAGEPGYTGVYLVMCLGPLLAALIVGRYDMLGGRLRTILLFVVLVTALVLCGGTTGYVGLAIAGTFGYALHTLFRGSRPDALSTHLRLLAPLAVTILVVVLGYQYLFGASFLDYISDVHVSKIQAASGSGFVRKAVAEHNFETFLASPVFGVGYGNDRGLAVSMFLLANTGFAGLTVFTLWMLSILGRGVRALGTSAIPDARRRLILGACTAFATAVALIQFATSESTLVFLYFWLFAAVCAPRVLIARDHVRRDDAEPSVVPPPRVSA